VTGERAEAILYESEAALRLVDQQLDDLGITADPRELAPELARPIPDLPLALEQAGAQIQQCIERLRAGRSALARVSPRRVADTQERLYQLSTATEHAAADILSGCERAVGLVDRLEPGTGAPTDAGVRGALREELYRMIGALQFQDIAKQQLAQCVGILDEMEHRLQEVAALFDLAVEEYPAPAPGHRPPVGCYDPDASFEVLEGRQELADALFSARAHPAA
jgi:hypothetical protein